MARPANRHDHPVLRRADLSPDPVEQFGRWFEAAREEVPLAEAMTLATAAPDGAPDARMVLLKGYDAEGFRFFTNLESVKAAHLESNPMAALVFYWRDLDRQVRVRGTVEPLDPVESGQYFATRPVESRLGAWASPQSRPLEGRDELERRFEEVRNRFAETEDVPDRITGAATCCATSGSSSGRASRPGFMTASSTRARTATGASSGWRPRRALSGRARGRARSRRPPRRSRRGPRR